MLNNHILLYHILDAAAFPGPPAAPKVVSAFDDCINLSWDAPGNKGGSRILGYILEKRKKGSNLWTVVNAMDELIKGQHFILFLFCFGLISHLCRIALKLFL